jgi:alpha-mannosidase II
MILDQWRKKSVLYRTNAVLVPLGDDFRYTTQLEAELQYNNYQVRGTHQIGTPSVLGWLHVCPKQPPPC